MNAHASRPSISPSTVTLGLFAAWAVHDLEEVATVARWSRTRVPVLRERHPGVPDRVWRSMEGVNGREFATAVAVMGLIVAAASADGYRTGGRSAFYQTSLNGFGLHGLVHVAQAAATRGYTPAWSPHRCSWSPSPCGRAADCAGPGSCGPRGRATSSRAWPLRARPPRPRTPSPGGSTGPRPRGSPRSFGIRPYAPRAASAR